MNVHEVTLNAPAWERTVSAPVVRQATDISRTSPPQVPRRRSLTSGNLAGKELEDPRAAVLPPVVRLKLEPLPVALRSPPPARAKIKTATSTGSMDSGAITAKPVEGDMTAAFTAWLGRFASAVCAPCLHLFPGLGKAKNEPPKHKPHRWYRIHPLGDGRYFVRPDAGWRGRMPGLRRQAKQNPDEDDTEQIKSHHRVDTIRRMKSSPCMARFGMKEEPGFPQDTFRDMCCVCYEEQVQVITLPCRHGCLCADCCRRTLFSRPAHRGGRACPVCRRTITEVVWIYGDAAIPQYGFTIKS